MKARFLRVPLMALIALMLVVCGFWGCSSDGATGQPGPTDGDDPTDGDRDPDKAFDCLLDQDCPDGEVCHEDTCIDPTTSPCGSTAECLEDSDCSAGWYCNDACICESLLDGDEEQDSAPDGDLGGCPLITVETTLDFGYVAFDTDALKTLHIANACEGPLTIYGVEIVSTSDEFRLINAPGETTVIEGPDGSLDIDVVYHPSDIGTDEGEILITSDAQKNSVRVALVTRYKGTVDIDASPNPLAFRDVVVGEEPVLKTLIVRNVANGENDNAALRVNAVWFENEQGPFTLKNDPTPFYLGQSGQRELSVSCAPGAEGEFSDRLIIESNDPDEGEYAVVLTCEGVQPKIGITPLDSGRVLDFGVQRAGVETVRSLTIENVGGGTLVVEPPFLTEDSADAFSLDTSAFAGSAISLTGGETVTIDVNYLSETAASHSGRLRILSNAYGDETFTVTINAEAAAASIEITPSPIDFDAVRVGTSFTRDVTISNTGEQAVTLVSIALDDDGGVLRFDAADVLADVVLDPQASHELSLTFAPDARGIYDTSLSIQTDDRLTPSLRAGIEARGIAPVLVLSSPDMPGFACVNCPAGCGTDCPEGCPSDCVVEFGEVRLNHRGSVTLKLANTGDADMMVERLEISSNTADSEFSLQAGGLARIQAGTHATVQLHYDPIQWPAPDAGALAIETDDPAWGAISLVLAGAAINPALSISPEPPIDFDPLHWNDSETKRVRLRNRGVAGVLVVNAITLDSGQEAFALDLNGQTLPVELYPENDQSFFGFDVVFNPKPQAGEREPAARDFAGTISVLTNSYIADQASLALSGTGEPCPATCWDLDEDPSVCEYCGCSLSGAELCDGIDNDCNGQTDEAANVTDNCTPPPNSEAVCNTGECDFSCDINFHRCALAEDPQFDEGCVFDRSPEHCGLNCEPCDSPMNAHALCVNDQGALVCSFECNEDYVWNGDACKLAGSVDCCGTECVDCGDNPTNGSWACENDYCVLYCNRNYHACGDECKSDFSVLSCGDGCGPCAEPSANGHATCDGESCGIACDGGFWLDGGECAACDTALHCGEECVDCGGDPTFGEWQCTEVGACFLDCDSGYHNCADDCVSNASLDTCGSRCAPCPAPADNGHATCDGYVCDIVCDAAHYRDGNNCFACTVPNHCGPACLNCGNNPANGSWACESDTCKLYCENNYHQCGTSCADNTSVLSCGTQRCIPCPEPSANGHATCDGVSCGTQCNQGYYALGTQCVTCNTPGHCGANCIDCGTLNNGVYLCDLGQCKPSCNEGFHLCNGICVADNSADHCGAFCQSCESIYGAVSHGDWSCPSGTCTPDCDDDYHACSNTCVYDFSPDHCGASCESCGTINNGFYTCPTGTCEPDCNDGFIWQGGSCIPGNTPDCCGDACEDCTEGLDPLNHREGVCVEDAPGVWQCETPCMDDWYDLDSDPLDCEYACVWESDVDIPDDEFTDSNCDGIDGTITKSIFVAATGSDGNSGLSPQTPLQSIQAAVSAAAASATRKRILISNGSYTGSVTLVDGLHLHGGYKATQSWQRSSSFVSKIVVSSSEPGDGRRVGVYAHDLTSSATLDLMHIQIDANGSTGGSNYGVHAQNADGLSVKGLTISMGQGGPGANGSNGQTVTTTGVNGSPGGDGCDDGHTLACDVFNNCGGSDATPGPGGTQNNCPYGAQPTRGGNGGAPGKDNEGGGRNGSPGASGLDGGGAGGTGGTCCSAPAEHGQNGQPGAVGASGSDAPAGDAFGNISAGWYAVAPAKTASDGNGGYGGGGGGGGAGGVSYWLDCESYGGAGGGGGSGGCGGQRATSGSGGGGVFGMFFVDTAPTISNIVVTNAAGGSGGTGGSGGSGSSGGSGGAGGDKSSSDNDASGDGGNGGSGGNGGRGGHGSGGGGGPSYCLYSDPSATAPTPINLTCTGYQGGSGGSGPLTNGQNGQAGIKNW